MIGIYAEEDANEPDQAEQEPTSGPNPEAEAKAAWLAKQESAGPWAASAAKRAAAAEAALRPAAFPSNTPIGIPSQNRNNEHTTAKTSSAPKTRFAAMAERAAEAGKAALSPAPFTPPPSERTNKDGYGFNVEEYGAEMPAPGREEEYAAYVARAGGGGANVPPPIDSDRRSRSPGLQNNFYDGSTADFKRPHGMAGGAVPTPEAPAQSLETEDESFMAQGGNEGAGSSAYVPPPIDSDRRSRSP
eukprot:7193304-Prymnesium_polylepis.1